MRRLVKKQKKSWSVLTKKNRNKKVKVGSHREKVGSRKVSNPAKRWWKIFTPKYIEEDVFETVDDYKDEDVYKTVLEYKTIMRDVLRKRKKPLKNSVFLLHSFNRLSLLRCVVI